MIFKGVLFDFDGVIADTMDYNYECWSRAFEEYGYTLDKGRYLRMEGTGARTIGQHFIEEIPHPKPSWVDIQLRKNEYFLKGYELVIYEQIPQILDLLDSAKIPYVIVTGSDRDRLIKTLDADLLDRFRGSVTMEDTERGKPFADPYKKGAEILKMAPTECVVVENAPAGIEAGKSAGSFTVGLKTTLTDDDLSKADLIFNDHTELLHWMKDRINGK